MAKLTYAALLCAASALIQGSFGREIQVKLSENTLKHLHLETNHIADNKPLGRVLVYVSKDGSKDPMHSCDDTQNTAQVFGVDYMKEFKGHVTIDDSILGYPVRSLSELQLADVTHYLQAKVTLYDEYHLEDGSKPIYPQSCISAVGGDGAYGDPPGTLFSEVYKVEAAPVAKAARSLRQVESSQWPTLVVDQVTPSDESGAPKCGGNGHENTKYIRTFRQTNERLSKFWGRKIVLEACVLVPFGFDDPEHADAHYPLVIAHSHYSNEWNAGGRFSEHAPAKEPESYADVDDQYAYYLYRNWTMKDSGPFHGARMLLITINHPVPVFDDSYAVNSANLGPYGDAIVYDFIPAIEKEFRGIGGGWARGVFGGSTGGWESLASLVFYPDEFNSAFASCPDPISFESFAQVNIYEYSNAYFYPAQFKQTPIPAVRGQYDGQAFPIDYGMSSARGEVSATMEEANRRELVLGTSSRSCGQWDAWTAVFSPKSEEGYPVPLYDKVSGEISPEVAEYWRENYDLTHILKKNWETLGPKINGKLHLFAGASDSFYLNNAVMRMQDFLESAENPKFEGEIEIGTHRGRGFAHCFSGSLYDDAGNKLPNSVTREVLSQRFLPIMAEHFAKTAPQGADTSSWRY